MDILELVHGDDKRTLIKQFICDDESCQKAFARRSDLIRHTRIHTNDRPYICEEEGCGKRFVQRSALTVHTRVHTGDRPHKCTWDGCDKAFGDSSSLARHRRIHTGARPYKCGAPTCAKSFCRRVTMTKHMRRAHPHVPIPKTVILASRMDTPMTPSNTGAPAPRRKRQRRRSPSLTESDEDEITDSEYADSDASYHMQAEGVGLGIATSPERPARGQYIALPAIPPRPPSRTPSSLSNHSAPPKLESSRRHQPYLASPEMERSISAAPMALGNLALRDIEGSIHGDIKVEPPPYRVPSPPETPRVSLFLPPAPRGFGHHAAPASLGGSSSMYGQPPTPTLPSMRWITAHPSSMPAYSACNVLDGYAAVATPTARTFDLSAPYVLPSPLRSEFCFGGAPSPTRFDFGPGITALPTPLSPSSLYFPRRPSVAAAGHAYSFPSRESYTHPQHERRSSGHALLSAFQHQPMSPTSSSMAHHPAYYSVDGHGRPRW